MIDALWLIPLGFAAGILGSMIGLGGGIIVVPVLTFAGFPPTIAASNSLFAAFSNAIASTISYSRQKRIVYSTGFRLGLLSVPGTILGAYFSSDVTPNLFKILFGLILLSSSIYIFLKRKLHTKKTNSKQVWILATGASFFAGIISSFFGIGGGIIFVPLMVVTMGMMMKHAAPTSQFILLFASFSGLLTHSFLGHPDYLQATFLALGAFGGGLVGARLSLDIKERYLQILVSVVIMIAAIKLFIDAIENMITF